MTDRSQSVNSSTTFVKGGVKFVVGDIPSTENLFSFNVLLLIFACCAIIQVLILEPQRVYVPSYFQINSAKDQVRSYQNFTQLLWLDLQLLSMRWVATGGKVDWNDVN